MAKITPELIVSNIETSLTFYNGLGFEKDNTGIVDERGSQWYGLSNGDADLQLLREDTVEGFDSAAARGTGVWLYLSVNDIDALYESLGKNPRGGTITGEIETMWYGQREFKITDPDGYVWTLTMPVSDVPSDATDGQS